MKGVYKITLDILGDDTLVMHPLPRVDEISKELDDTKHALYFKQASYGIPVRMVILDLLLNQKKK